MFDNYDWLLDSLLFCGKLVVYVVWHVFLVMMTFFGIIVIAFKIIEQFNFSNNRNANSVNFDCKNVEDYELHVEKYIDEDSVSHTSYTIRKILYEDEDEDEEYTSDLDAVDNIKRSEDVE